jgi:uncharacterized membrane protein
MASLGQFFVLIAFVVPFGLFVWFLVSSVGRITRSVEDMAMTLRRIEQNGSR